MRPYTILAIAVLIGMSAWHAVSLYLEWAVLIGSWLVPIWLRVALLFFTGGLAWVLWIESFSLRNLK